MTLDLCIVRSSRALCKRKAWAVAYDAPPVLTVSRAPLRSPSCFSSWVPQLHWPPCCSSGTLLLTAGKRKQKTKHLPLSSLEVFPDSSVTSRGTPFRSLLTRSERPPGAPYWNCTFYSRFLCFIFFIALILAWNLIVCLFTYTCIFPLGQWNISTKGRDLFLTRVCLQGPEGCLADTTNTLLN